MSLERWVLASWILTVWIAMGTPQSGLSLLDLVYHEFGSGGGCEGDGEEVLRVGEGAGAGEAGGRKQAIN